MLKKIIFLTLFFNLVWPSFLGAESSGKIIINSYRVAGLGASTDEFVELFNPGSEPILITGWQLAKKTATGTKYNLVASFPPAEIKPKESLIVGHKDSTEEVAIYYSSTYSISEDNTIILFSDNGKTVIDRVGFGKASDFEGAPAPSAGLNAWTRTSGIDTDNNIRDFKKAFIGSGDYSGICLSEIMPAPKDGEEWIEIYNSEVSKNIGGLVIADKIGAVKKFTVPEGTTIEEGQYLVFYKKETGITLNDDGDGVALYDQSEKVIDDTGPSFGRAKKGYSYASDGEKWYWTETPTPGTKNIINLPQPAISSTKKTPYPTSPTTSKKGTLPKTEVRGASQSNDNIFGERGETISDKERFVGKIMILVAIFGGIFYTIYTNREKLIELYNEKRSGNSKSWQRVIEKIQKK